MSNCNFVNFIKLITDLSKREMCKKNKGFIKPLKKL